MTYMGSLGAKSWLVWRTQEALIAGEAVVESKKYKFYEAPLYSSTCHAELFLLQSHFKVIT